VKYIIFFQPRSGSSFLSSKLNLDESISYNPGEIFDNYYLFLFDDDLKKNADINKLSIFDKKDLLTRFFRKYKQTPYVGCKIAPYQISNDIAGFYQYSITIVDKLLFLIRDNPVQTAISQMWSLGRFHQHKSANLVDEEENTLEVFYADPEVFEYYVITSIIERDTVLSLSKIPKDKLVLTYEDMLKAPEKLFKEVTEFLELPESVMLNPGNIRKSRTTHPSKHIKNYDEIVTRVKKMGFDVKLLDEN